MVKTSSSELEFHIVPCGRFFLFTHVAFFVDCTFLEIAEITEMRQSAVKNRLYRTLEKLRKELKEYGHDN